MSRKIIMLAAVVAVTFFAGMSATKVVAVSDEHKSNIAVVSIPKIMAESKYAASMQTEIMEQKDSSLAELEKLKAQMEAVRADMETRKKDSKEYLDLKLELMQKRAVAEAQKDFLQDELMAKNKIAMENLYIEILDCVKEIAQAKGIELVLDSDEVSIPAPNVNELTMMVQTHKVLHYAPYLDITDEVIKLIDSK
ncbi:MAG: OmpH family outer membrane protein [Sedimentisphaeraceae bacterium JB056]